MFRILKIAICAMLGFAAVERASAFTVFGPAESWQTPVLDYVTRYYYGNDSELGGPKNFGEGSRINIPVITYAYDYTFLTFFGTKGVAAVDAAMNEINSLPPASTARLSKFLTQGNQSINYTAQALSVTDIKSTVMSLMLEHMGLLGETHVWDLHARALPAGAPACQYQYIVINRNYDPVTYNPSAYVNGVQYGYAIVDFCTSGVAVADAIEQTVDQTSPAQFDFTAVATRYGQEVGGFYHGITRDDMGGLAYLYRPNNFAYETLDTNSIIEGTGNSTWVPVNSSGTNAAATGFAGLLGGVDKITYVKVAYDSILGQAFTPRTFTYSVPFVTNGTLSTMRISRTVTQPDILFTAGDLVGPAFTAPLTYNAIQRGFNYVSNGLVTLGPGAVVSSVISPQEIITFNNVTGIYVDASPSFLDSLQFGLYPVLLWGHFDGTTNAPVIFPQGSSITSLEQEVISGQSSITVGTYNPVNILGTNAASTGTGTTGQTSTP